MATRLRILLVGLAIAVVATIVAVMWVAAPSDSKPAVFLAVKNVTNYMGKTAVIAVTNRESCGVSLTGWRIELEGPQDYRGRPSWPMGTNLPRRATCLISMDFPTPYWTGPPEGRRWRVVCVARRDTWLNRMRVRTAKLPRVGQWISAPTDYMLASELHSP